ncbi:MAG TPA: HIRAN domain-containing protein [Rhodanobacter sp.]
MQRRRFLIHLSEALAAFGALPGAANARPRADKATQIHLQDCRIAGGHYYDCPSVLSDLRPSDARRSRRQPGNPHEERAIEVLWHGRKLGYLPRPDNAAAASLLDRTHDLRGKIFAVDNQEEELEPIRLRVWIYAHHGDAR